MVNSRKGLQQKGTLSAITYIDTETMGIPVNRKRKLITPTVSELLPITISVAFLKSDYYRGIKPYLL